MAHPGHPASAKACQHWSAIGIQWPWAMEAAEVVLTGAAVCGICGVKMSRIVGWVKWMVGRKCFPWHRLTIYSVPHNMCIRLLELYEYTPIVVEGWWRPNSCFLDSWKNPETYMMFAFYPQRFLTALRPWRDTAGEGWTAGAGRGNGLWEGSPLWGEAPGPPYSSMTWQVGECRIESRRMTQ